ncbi:hypothetical protein [Rhodoferax ferrireducens]|nr:hypothetical protein [Rhodoferax ferrireducens]
MKLEERWKWRIQWCGKWTTHVKGQSAIKAPRYLDYFGQSGDAAPAGS